MKKKLVSILLCATMVAGLAVGCGGKKEEGGDKGGDKLVYWSMWSEEEPQAKVIKEAIAKYTEDTGVEVDVTDSVKVLSRHYRRNSRSTYSMKM